MTIRSFAKDLIPPALLKIRRILVEKFASKDRFFDGDDTLFKKYINHATVYGEYGVGSSTVWVHENVNCPIVSVDTDQNWIQNVKSKIGRRDHVNLKWVDLGEIGEWGRPKTYEKRDNFYKYIDYIWSTDLKPDLILIDGRFRVCCFLTSLAQASPGAVIIFDDYTNRPHYHVVEEFVRPDEFCGRQAKFTVPNSINRDLILDAAKRFLYVMD